MIRGILFDKDGTLIEFESVWHEIFRIVFEDLELEFHLNEETINGLKKISGYLEDEFERESIIQHASTSEIVTIWIDYINKVNDPSKENITYSKLLQLIDQKAVQEDIPIHALDGVKELLVYLKEKGYQLGVATGDTRNSTKHCLKKAGIIDYFDYLGCNEEGVMTKPSADMAIRFCKQFQLNAEELLIVGDSLTDMRFADNAKANFVGIITKYNNHDEFKANHKHTVEHIYDIIKIYNL